MMSESAAAASNRAAVPELDLLELHESAGSTVDEILAGLQAVRKFISPKFFYDERGSALFERITTQPEYYPTRTELAILERAAGELPALVGANATVVEYGAGASRKIRLILEGLRPRRYVPMDISGEFLRDAASRLSADYDWLDVTPVRVDHSRRFPHDRLGLEDRTVAFFPGSSIGNFDPAGARLFLARARELIGAGGTLLIGVDRKKDPAVLHDAYNDAAGITAAFNLNVLAHVNRLANAAFDPADFAHLAFYNADAGRIEMHLRSLRSRRVVVGGSEIALRAGEVVHTENSWKYAPAEFLSLAADCGLELIRQWTDDREWFSVFLLRPAGAAR